MKISVLKNYTIHLVTFLIVFSSCKKDNNGGSGSTTRKVQFKAEASAGSNINMVVYGYDATLTTASSLSGTTWTSPEITVPSSAKVSSVIMNGIGANASSTLKVQIFVNGTLKKEGTGSGTALSAQAQYNF